VVIPRAVERTKRRWPSRRRTPAERRLHFGAFDDVHDGWHNTDVTPHLLIARVPVVARLARRLGRLSAERWAAYEDGRFRRLHYLDLTRRLPYRDHTFEAAFGAHVLEHLTPAESQAALRELHRVLQPGAVLRIAVPDLDREVAAYDRAAPDAFLAGFLQGRTRSRSRHRHWWHYNERNLREALERAGFRDVRRERFGVGRCPDVERIDVRPESLFMEGIA
jgi:predicted SAM-dependent methyltransferase